MKLSVIAFFAVFAVLSGCVLDDAQKQADAFAADPQTETGHASEKEGCEVKGSGAYNPCHEGTAKADTGKSAAAPAPKPKAQFTPSQCETGPQAMFPVFGAMLSGTLEDLQDYCTSIGYGDEGQRASSAPTGAASSGQGCGNPFGGKAARSGEFICSDEGELQACQCSGGSCRLKPTGSFLCTSPGAVIR
jgi:hypothetical protein